MTGRGRIPRCGEGSGPQSWLQSLAECFQKAFETEVAINHPFRGGCIIRSHAKELPWVQIELSREPFLSPEEKSRCVLRALTDWCSKP